MPESHLLNLACRYGGKVRCEAATTCRFLLEAPPLSNVDRSGTGHGRPKNSVIREDAWERFPTAASNLIILTRDPTRRLQLAACFIYILAARPTLAAGKLGGAGDLLYGW